MYLMQGKRIEVPDLNCSDAECFCDFQFGPKPEQNFLVLALYIIRLQFKLFMNFLDGIQFITNQKDLKFLVVSLQL
jgi:hypothetical protein